MAMNDQSENMEAVKDDGKFAALNDGDWVDFFGNPKPKCPHCGSDFEIDENEAWSLYNENDTHEVDCTSCNRIFQVSSSCSWTFSTEDQEGNE